MVKRIDRRAKMIKDQLWKHALRIRKLIEGKRKDKKGGWAEFVRKRCKEYCGKKDQ